MLDGAWQHGGEDCAERRAVIRTDPAGELEEVRGNERGWVDDLADGLEGTLRSTLGELEAEADLGAICPSERGLDALANLKGVGEVGRDMVIKELVQGRIEGKGSQQRNLRLLIK